MKLNPYIFAFLVALGPIFSAHAVPKYLHQVPSLCEYLLATPEVRLSDLVSMDMVEPDGDFLNSPSDAEEDHEIRTARVLAERLRRPLAVLPRLSRTANVPAVDGILFDDEGRAVTNFSLKTFMPSSSPRMDLNEKLLEVMRVARRSVEKNYSVERWQEIIGQRLPQSLPAEKCDQECQVYAKVFGLTAENVRPVTVVIDYTQDPTAILRLHMRLDAKGTYHSYLTLNSYDNGINLLHLMQRIREHKIVKEYVFLGAHHLFSITADGFQMTEFCDDLGHSHSH